MKNRLLPCCFSALLLGFSLFLFSNLTFANGPDKTAGSDQIQKIRQNQVTGTVNPADVIKARLQLENLNTKTTAGLGLDWKSMGPANFSGRSRVVLFDNTDATGSTLYTGAVTGGVWKSTNLGLTWSRLNTSSDVVLNVSAMTQLSSGVIYLGTGEWRCDGGTYMGTGLYKSEDGENFTLIPATAPVVGNTNSDWAFVKKLTNNPSTGRLFAITNLGVRYSDNGNDWYTVKDGNATDIVVGPDGCLIMAVDGEVYVSATGDINSFVNVSGTGSNKLPLDDVGNISLAVAPGDANIMYASIAKESDGLLLNVYRSADKGTTWSVIFPSNSTWEPFEGLGCYANTIVVFPDNPDKVLLGGVNAWCGYKVSDNGYFNWDQISYGFSAALLGYTYIPYFHYNYVFSPASSSVFAVASDKGITIGRITDDVFSFQTTNKNLMTTQMNSVAFSTYKDAVMGGGVSNGIQVIGALETNNQNYGVDLISKYLNVDYYTGSNCEWSMINPKTVFYGAAENASSEPYYRSDDLGSTVSPTFLSGLTSSLTDYLPIKYWESFHYDNTQDSVLYYATDTIAAGETITGISANVKYPFLCTAPVDMLPGDSVLVPDYVQSRFFIYGTNGKSGVFMTKQALQFSVDPDWYQLAETSALSCMNLSDDMNYLWAGTPDGKLYRISNISLAYDSLTADLNSPQCVVATEEFNIPEFAGRYITSVSFAPGDDKTLMVTLGNYGNDDYVYMTSNALDSLPTFTSVQGNLPSSPVYSGIFEMHGGNKVIIGTDLGIFTSDNLLSGTWTSDYTGLGVIPVTMLKQQTMNNAVVENFGTIYAASYGNGIFRDTTYFSPLGIDPVVGNDFKAGMLKIMPNPAKEKATVVYALDNSSNVTVSVYDLTGRLLLSNSLGKQAKGQHSTTVDLSGLSTGTFILKVNNDYAKVVKIQ